MCSELWPSFSGPLHLFQLPAVIVDFAAVIFRRPALIVDEVVELFVELARFAGELANASCCLSKSEYFFVNSSACLAAALASCNCFSTASALGRAIAHPLLVPPVPN